ncbi:hypothetical protein EAI30_03545 [Romboutsia ilealis]|uniref:Uncharacterized protein n=1 Tax=Romboutsia faecis TaxID=2764597 RepID=A0ABR7JKN6_9FIRM|nr:hypothetical protein [Romboutsia faecis]MBC5995485.1 hypothetical protein [Romboutsia faecis]MRN23686.1 hypothetical protein [Romboutsia ilealis]
MQYKIREIKVNREQEEITLAENDAIRIYKTWKADRNEDVEECLESIIKVDLPNHKHKALKMLKDGIKVDGEMYVSFATTPGLMKKSGEGYSCEYFFIKESDKEFIDIFYDVISLGKLKEKYNTELCINKDIISRVGLAFSTGERVNIKCKKAILPEMTYTYISNYLQFAENEDGKIDLDNLKLEKHPNKEVEHIAMDGSGFMMPVIADKIEKKLNLKYKLSWVGIRELGVASKGLLVKFDFKKYLKEEHGLNKLIVKDFWGDDVDLFEVDVIINNSQVKWSKWFKNRDEIEELKKLEKYKPYSKLLDGFTITKINKEHPTKYTEANYQILSNLNLTPKELDELSKETEDIYERVINGNIDVIRIMLGDVARENEEHVLSASTKLHKLLQLDENMKNLQYSYKTIGNIVNKKVNNLAGGGLYLKGNYKVVIKDAFSYIDSLIEQKYNDKGQLIGTICQRGLKDNTNYVPGESGKRVLARSPLNSATELIKTELVNHELYNKYFDQLSSDICFYPFNDFMMRQSGEDEDTDISFVIDEEIIYNSVIEDIDKDGNRWYFRNQFDGAKPDIRLFNDDNMYKAILRTRGNLIGKLSNYGAKISNKIQELPCYDNVKKCYCDYRELEDKQNFINHEKIDDEIIKNHIYNKFQNYKLYSYYTLYLQMVAIDSPKTCVMVGKHDLEPLRNISLGKKPQYIYYAKYKKEDKLITFNDVSWTNSLLNNYSSRIISLYGYKARSINEKEYNNIHLFKVLTKKNDAEIKDELLQELSNLNNEYNHRRESLDIHKDISEIKVLLSRVTSKSIEEALKAKLNELNDIKNTEYTKIDIDISDKYKILIKDKYDYLEILKALSIIKTTKGNRISTRFIMEFCFEELIKHLLKLNNGLGTIYTQDENGGIRYLYENYKKVDAEISEVDLTEKEGYKKKEKLGQLIKCRVGKLSHKDLTDQAILENKKIYNSKRELLGELFKKVDVENGVYDVKYDYITDKCNEYKLAKSMSVYVEL